jgi:hypothetical protein
MKLRAEKPASLMLGCWGDDCHDDNDILVSATDLNLIEQSLALC